MVGGRGMVGGGGFIAVGMVGCMVGTDVGGEGWCLQNFLYNIQEMTSNPASSIIVTIPTPIEFV